MFFVSSASGQFAAYAMVTSISNPCGNFKIGGSLVTLGCTRPPKGMWFLANREANHRLKNPLLIIDIFLPLKVQIPITFCNVITSVTQSLVTSLTERKQSKWYTMSWNNMYTVAMNCLCAHSLEGYHGAYFPSRFATLEINTRITLEWAHKQFATRTHTLLSFSSLDCALSLHNNIIWWPSMNTIACIVTEQY